MSSDENLTCPTCGLSGPPADIPGELSNHVRPGASECVTCGVARHYGWFILARMVPAKEADREQ